MLTMSNKFLKVVRKSDQRQKNRGCKPTEKMTREEIRDEIKYWFHRIGVIPAPTVKKLKPGFILSVHKPS